MAPSQDAGSFVRPKTYYVYILSNGTGTTFYIGVTNNLGRRIVEHQSETIEGFTKKYHLHKLVYFETYHDIMYAIAREKQLKRWKREWKIALIQKLNPGMRDLSMTWSWSYIR